ncbi:MAG: hypothetical protein ABI759_03325 [Candidatus Solibacter sp.]
MKLFACSAAAVLSVMCLGIGYASGPIGIYGLVEKVAFEPSADKPDHIRITGVFITVEDGSAGVYSAPQRGYLYLALPRGNEQLVRREWEDLKSIAGSRQIVGLGSVWTGRAMVRVRKSDEEAKSPDDYPLGNGLAKINPDHPRAKALLEYKDR